MYLLLYLVVVNLPCGDFNKGISGLEYGPYEMQLSHFELCKGKKETNLTHIDVALVKSPDNKYMFQKNITFLTADLIVECKIEVFEDSREKVLLWHYNIKNPCNHFLLGPIFMETYGTDSKCLAKKGTVSSTVNISDTVEKFVGPKFYYGTFFCKFGIIAKKGNVYCSYQKISFTKKTST